MRNFYFLSKKSLSNGNGSGMDREWIGIASAFSHKLFALLFCLLFIGVGNVWGAVSTLTFTSACGGSGTAGDGATWTVTSDASESTYDGTKGVHYGTSGVAVSYVQLTNSTIAGRKTQVVVNASGASSTSAVISVTVGSTSFLCGGKKTVAVSTTATAYTFTGVGTGNIVVRISQTSAKRAIYCKSIAVTYSTDKYTVNFDKGSGVCVTTSLKETNAGDGVELPVATPPSDCVTKGWVFAGWKESSAVSSPTFVEPTLYEAEATYYPTADNTTLYAVYKLSEERTGCTAGKVNATGDLAVGDCVILYYESGKVQYNGLDGNTYGTKTAYTTTPASTHILEVQEGNSTGQLAFYDKTDKNYLSYSGSSNALQTSEEINANSSWVVTVTSGVATIQNASVTTRYIKYNKNSPRFAGYESDAGNTEFVNLYKVCPPLVTYNSNPDCTYDYFVDIMHDNETIEKQGTYSAPAALSDADKGEDTYCDEKHYHFLGWVEEAYIKDDGTLDTEAVGFEIIPAGDSGHTAANKTFYAIWGKEE